MPDLVLTLSCIDRRGIVGAVGSSIAAQEGNIVESAQYFDRASGRFFMRVHFTAPDGATPERFLAGFRPTVLAYDMDAAVTDRAHRQKVLILVSGTHGIEGNSGSGRCSGWLAGGFFARQLGKTRRSTRSALRGAEDDEDIDLNRSFIDHAKPRPANADYEAIAAHVDRSIGARRPPPSWSARADAPPETTPRRHARVK